MKNKIVFYTKYIITYALMIGVTLTCFCFIPLQNVILRLAISSLCGLMIIYLISLITKNSNIYNLYFAVSSSLVTILYATTVTELNLQSYIMITLILLWTIRMIVNFFMKNIDDKEDYRYADLRKNKLWVLINLFFVHIIPAVIFFLVIIPTFNYIELSTFHSWNLSTIIALGVCVFGLHYEMIADLQKYKFKKVNKNPLDVCTFGLWSTSRHPNYFGEIIFWWGTFLMMLSLSNKFLVTAMGPLLLTMMICFVSIPRVEKKQVKEKADYSKYIELVSMIIPLKRNAK